MASQEYFWTLDAHGDRSYENRLHECVTYSLRDFLHETPAIPQSSVVRGIERLSATYLLKCRPNSTLTVNGELCSLNFESTSYTVEHLYPRACQEIPPSFEFVNLPVLVDNFRSLLFLSAVMTADGHIALVTTKHMTCNRLILQQVLQIRRQYYQQLGYLWRKRLVVRRSRVATSKKLKIGHCPKQEFVDH